MAKSKSYSSNTAFFRFHLNVGIRLALRTFAPVISAVFALYYLLKPEFLVLLLKALFIDSDILTSGIISAAISLSVAGIAAPRVCLGLDGWIRHLPLSSQAHRRLAGFAIFVAQLPVLIILAILSYISTAKTGRTPSVYLLGLPLLGISSALFVLPVKQKNITRPLAALACVCVTSANWVLVLGGAVLVMVVDSISGPLSPSRKRPNFRRALRGSLLPLSIAWRALRLRLFFPYLPSLLFLGATSVFLSNNTPDPSLSIKVIRTGGALSLVFLCTPLANLLALRRPPWPWVRSLPWSARQRILIDSAFLALPSIPLLALTALMDIRAIFPLAASLPLFVFRCSAVIRQAQEHRTGTYGMLLRDGFLGALSLGLVPLISLVFLAFSPFALKEASKREQTQKVSGWFEMHHLAAGDPLSWSQ